MITYNKTKLFFELLRLAPARVLELGPCDGSDAIVLAKFCQRLVSIEAKPRNIEIARETWANAGGEGSIEFIEGNLESFELSQLGRFDLVFASGILYHLPAPWELIAEIAAVTDCVLGWPHFAERGDEVSMERYGVWYTETPEHPYAGLSERSFWLTADEFAHEWASHGFMVRFLTPLAPHENGGLAAQFKAERIR